MAKIPFNIKYRPQIESGKYKVMLDCGVEAEIFAWDKPGKYPIVCMAKKEGAIPFRTDNNGIAYHYPESSNYSDLFIVTPEEELTEFEKKLWEVLKSEGSPIGPIEKFTDDDKRVFHAYAAKLLALAIDARAGELSEGLEQSKIDKDSIPYHLIEFMCNLYDCQNWKEIEDTAELYTTRVKAAALKDLPRWKKWGNGACGNGIGVPLAIVKRGRENYKLVDVLCFNGEKYIMLSDLEKLPGFKED